MLVVFFLVLLKTANKWEDTFAKIKTITTFILFC